MYFLKQGKKAFACKLEGMTQKIDGVDCILQVRSPVELRSIRQEDWEQLLDVLEKESRCEAVILDLGGTVNGLFELLDACDWIYTPTNQEETAKAKFGQYEDTLKILELDEIMKRTTVLEASGKGGFCSLLKERAGGGRSYENRLGGSQSDIRRRIQDRLDLSRDVRDEEVLELIDEEILRSSRERRYLLLEEKLRMQKEAFLMRYGDLISFRS